MLSYAMRCYVMLCYPMLSYAMLCYAMLCYAILCHAMLCYAILSSPLPPSPLPSFAMLSYPMPCYAVLCYAILCYTLLYTAMLCYPVTMHRATLHGIIILKESTYLTLVHASYILINVNRSPSFDANRLCACPAFLFSSSLYGWRNTVSEESSDTAVIISTTHLHAV